MTQHIKMATDATAQFLEAIAATGLRPPATIVTDGRIHRFSTNGKRGDDSGWYVFYGDGLPTGSFGDWRTRLTQGWCAKSNRTMTTEEHAAHAKRLKAIQLQRDAEELRRHAEATQKACSVWDSARPATDQHPYLAKKRVKAHGLRTHKDGRLIVPLRDLDGNLHSVQFIDPAGQKRFLAGGKKHGLLFVLGDLADTGPVCLTEGFATGATVHEATGHATVVAFDAGNLLPVAQAIRKKFPDVTILVCGDHDGSGVGQKAARETAEAVGGRVAIPAQENTDWNDVHVRDGVGAVKTSIEAAIKKATSTTEDPEPISLEVIELPSLPASCIPVPWLHDMIEAVAAATETPRELACLLSLAVVATATMRRYSIEPEGGYVEGFALWVCCALDSGLRKTPVLKRVVRPLLSYERKQSAALAQTLCEANSARKLADDRIKHLRHKAARAGGADLDALREALAKAEASAPEVPIEPRLWCQDVTPERLGVLMADHGGAMAILSDEGGIFDILAGRYSQGVLNLDLFLQAFSGSPYRVDRGSRPAVFLESPKLTIGLSPQPAVLAGLVKQPSFRGRGLLARFFYAVPPTTLGFRQLVARPIPEVVESRYDAAITTLLAQPVPVGDLRRLVFAPDAYQEWKCYQRHMEDEMRPGGAFENLTDWGSKCPGGAARLAGILHCAKHAHGEPADHHVDTETTTAALTLSSVFERHAVAAFGMMGADATVESAKRVWAWIHQGRRRTFSRRDVFNGLRGQFLTVEALRPALLSLEERGYIFPIVGEKRAGRPTYRFRVNSGLIGGWK